ncbi:sensor histidine kinase [Pseudoalteromonas denitrificans]|uniref:sensor histidine kinase n=1 Tax=Pseudoalteromonas denitrificans TaxID=43656 RepID=UPI000B8A1791|nr:ATP-binding protein [Pseudoalteromonas denitrificans]
MKRLFWEIYSVILFSIFGVLLLSYYALNSVNQYRYQAHLQDIMSGTVSLLKSGIDRQKGENQQRWLSLSASLLNSDLSIRPLDKSKQDQPIIPISRYQKNKELEYFVIQQKLNTSNELFEFKFETFTEQIATATAFLLLNEIGRFDASERQEVFDKISESFSYPVYRSRRQDLNFDSRQLERLDRGETIIEWNKQFGRGLSINVYAPWGKSADVLVMGAIAFFEPYPVKIVISFFIFSLLLIAISVFFIIKHLSYQLYKLQDKVDAISPSHLPINEQATDSNVIAQLTLKVQNMAQRIEKLLGEKAYMIRAVSHDLRTPIAKMHFRLEVLSEHLADDDTALMGCYADLEQLGLLIDELLTYEKLTLQQNINFKSVDLISVLESQIQSTQLLYPELSIKIDTQLSPPNLLDVNEALFNRLLDNLLSNASRYAKTKIKISVFKEVSSFKIMIDDDGCGLDESTIPELFNPFYRAESSRNNEFGGYGLGLAIVKQVALQHNASIEVVCNPWGGARFILHFPLVQIADEEEVNYVIN